MIRLSKVIDSKEGNKLIINLIIHMNYAYLSPNQKNILHYNQQNLNS